MIYGMLYRKELNNTIKNIPNIDMMKNKKILITGSTGLIGSSIVDTLAWENVTNNSNIHIYAAGRNKEKVKERFKEFSDKGFFTFVEYDANKDLMFDMDVEYIIHGASNAHPIAYSAEPVETMIKTMLAENEIIEPKVGLLKVI